ncbi:MAG: DUF3089 domain-containing protein [Acidobacteriia bacterium]|nr:DUF3089 domain-containing protein [Terriglobia bacterium]
MIRLVVCALLLAAAAFAEGNDYRDTKNWLCRPGGHDACEVDLTATVVAADGSLTRETWAADPGAPIDCFYVYPTVSTDTTTNSDMTADPAERNVIRHQFARFASKCRPFAPLYRQVTLAGLSQLMAGKGSAAPLGTGLAYDDVAAAFRDYLEHDNRGRGFVLIGHSQGSFVLAELIKREIEGKPVAARMISAILSGTTITPQTFSRIPVCKAPSQVGCVIAFASFRSTVTPPANTLFGKNGICTNPAALDGGSGELKAYLSATGSTITRQMSPKPWVSGAEKVIDTPWVAVPGLLSARCASNDHSNYLEVTVQGNPDDPRTEDITGDISSNGQVLAQWGLHLLDMNLAMGNLVEIVGRQTTAYLKTVPR